MLLDLGYRRKTKNCLDIPAELYYRHWYYVPLPAEGGTATLRTADQSPAIIGGIAISRTADEIPPKK